MKRNWALCVLYFFVAVVVDVTAAVHQQNIGSVNLASRQYIANNNLDHIRHFLLLITYSQFARLGWIRTELTLLIVTILL